MEYFQTAINKEIEDVKIGKINHNIEDMEKLFKKQRDKLLDTCKDKD